MSVQAIGWVLDHSSAKGTDRLVLIAIANHASRAPADGAWEAWPGVETIQREAGLDRGRTVQDALARLVTAGLLERVTNGAPDERIRRDRRPNLYRITLAHGVPCHDTRCTWCGVTPDAARGDASRHDGVTPHDATGCRRASPEPSLNRQVNRQGTELPPPAGAGAGSLFASGGEPSAPRAETAAAEEFDRFWTAYPRREGKGDARRAWPVAVKAAGSAARIIDGAERYRDDPNRVAQFTAHPSTWLRAERWNDDPLPPRTAPAGPTTRTTPAIITDRARPSGRIDL